MLAVVAIDGSPESEAAVEFVSSNCLPPNGQLLVLLCRPQQGSAYSDSHMPPASPVRCRCLPLEDFLPLHSILQPLRVLMASQGDVVCRRRPAGRRCASGSRWHRCAMSRFAVLADASTAELQRPTTQALLTTSAASVAYCAPRLLCRLWR